MTDSLPAAPYPQDLHVHTVHSHLDSAVEPQQTVELVAAVRHARVLGISDHLDCVTGGRFEPYARAVRGAGLVLGIEVGGPEWVDEALERPVDYYNFHCFDTADHYRAAGRLAASGRPTIIAHPLALGTDLDRVPPECLIEINNRYVWRSDWRAGFQPWLNRFRFVIGSDAHQPNWLGQHTARWVARELGVRETILFPERLASSQAGAAPVDGESQALAAEETSHA